jgi:hypothetical protein
MDRVERYLQEFTMAFTEGMLELKESQAMTDAQQNRTDAQILELKDVSADASDTIEHLKSEHSENFGNILSLLRLSAVSESVKLLLRITCLADFMNSGIDRKQFTVFHHLAEHHQSCGYLSGLMSAAVGKEHSAFWRYILCSAMGHSWSDG